MPTVTLLAGWWLMIRMPKRSYQGEVPALEGERGPLAERLARDVGHLALMGPRHYHEPQALHRAEEWLAEELSEIGYDVHRQTYPVSGVACSNLIAERAGRTKPEEIVVVGAHYDTEPVTPGADDNASGVAALLELARRFSDAAPRRTVRFIAFVNEEMPHFTTQTMGSMQAARSSRQTNEHLAGMISLESIGYFSSEPDSQKYPPPLSLIYPDRGNFIGFVSNIESRALLHRSLSAFRERARLPSEGAVLPEFVPGVGWSDHSSYWRYDYPAIMVTDTAPFRNPHYHQPSDTPDTLDYQRLTQVVLGMKAVIEELAN